MKGLIGKKIGMTSIFDEKGNAVGVTVVEVGPNIVTQVKTVKSDGYNSIQLSYGKAREKNTPGAMMGHFKKAGAGALSQTSEFRDMPHDVTFKLEEETTTVTKKLGDQIRLEELFSEKDIIQVVGTSKGKGFQGVVKRHNFSGVGESTRGQHNRLRAPGSIGASSFPSKVFKGMRMAGRMGNDVKTVKGLKIVKILKEDNLLLIHGAVPGAKNGYVIIEK